MNKSCVPKVSVIIPVYRSLEHIQETIDCLQKQTLKELEFIFIDDKGNDGTFDIVRKAAQVDNRIVCLENEVNSGPGVARNKGIEAAKGEFIAFVDSDDMLSPNYYEKLYDKAIKTGALAVKCKLQRVMSDGKKVGTRLDERIKRQIKENRSSMLRLWTEEHTAGIYSRRFILDCGARNCETARRDQDTCFQMMAMLHLPTSRFAMEESVTYYYVQREKSLIHRPRDAYFLEQMLLSAKFKVEFLMQNLDKEDCPPYLSMIIDLRLQTILEADLESSVTPDVIAHYINYFSDTMKTWQAISSETYKEGPIARGLRQTNYNALIFHATGKWYLQYIEQRSKLQELERELKKLQHQIENVHEKTCIDESSLRRQLQVLRLKRFFSIGKKKRKYKQKIAACKELLRNTF